MKTIDYTYNDEGAAIEHLINLVIDSKVNTCVPCEVVESNKGKVSVRTLVMPKEADVPPVVFHNIMAVLPAGGGLRVYHPITKGDRGLLITCKYDLIEFKKSLESTKTKTGRTFDINDSVFIPIHFNTRDFNTEDVTFVYDEKAGDDAAKIIMNKEGIEIRGKSRMGIKTGQAHITFVDNKITIATQGQGEVEIVGDSIRLDCETIKSGTLRAVLDSILSLLDDLSSGMAGSGTNNAKYTASKPTHEGTLRKIMD